MSVLVSISKKCGIILLIVTNQTPPAVEVLCEGGRDWAKLYVSVQMVSTMLWMVQVSEVWSGSYITCASCNIFWKERGAICLICFLALRLQHICFHKCPLCVSLHWLKLCSSFHSLSLGQKLVLKWTKPVKPNFVPQCTMKGKLFQSSQLWK